MSGRIEATSTSITSGRVDALDHGDGGCGDGHVVSGRDPVLRTGLGVPERLGRKLRNDIVSMREAVVGTTGLASDEVCEG